MKQYKLYVTGILSLILFIACDVNTLDEVKSSIKLLVWYRLEMGRWFSRKTI